MPAKRLTPMRPAIASGEVRAHLRQTDSEESSLIANYLLASQNDIEIQCERAMTVARYRVTLQSFPCGPLNLMMCPVRKIESITYYDTANTPVLYEDFNLFSDEEPGVLMPAIDTDWPSTYQRKDAVTIVFWAGHLIPISLTETEGSGDPEYVFTSVTGYPIEDGDEIVISSSGNSNCVLGEIAAVPSGVELNTTYVVVDAVDDTFSIAETEEGEPVSIGLPTVDVEGLDLLFVGQIEPYHRLALLQMCAKAFGERCPAGGCVCTAEDFQSNPMLRRLKWRSPVEFY